MDPEELVAADPMMRVLRERHPDVDIVLLPPQDLAPPAVPPTPGGACRALQRHTLAVADTLADRVGHEPAHRLGFWWPQSHPLVHRWVVRVDFTVADGSGVELLREVSRTLLGLGWDARPAADGSARMRALSGPLELLAEATAEHVQVSVMTAPLHIEAPVMSTLDQHLDDAAQVAP